MEILCEDSPDVKFFTCVDKILRFSPPCFLACRFDLPRETRRQAKTRRGGKFPKFCVFQMEKFLHFRVHSK
jgi:hypothetical protein